MTPTWCAPLVFSATLLSAQPVLAADPTPTEVAQKFCDTHLPGTAAAEQATMALLTPSLLAAMNAAIVKDNDYQAAHPDDKPPLGDGVPFQSYSDVAPKCIAATVPANATEVDIEYRFDDPEANWTDRVVLAKVDGRLMVDDILYGVNGFQEGLRSNMAGVGEPVTIEE